MSLSSTLEKQRQLMLSEPITNLIELPLSSVSSLYGPGNVIAWLLVALSVIVDSYTRRLERRVNTKSPETLDLPGPNGIDYEDREKPRAGTNEAHRHVTSEKLLLLDPNVIGALIYPVIAAADVIYRRHKLASGVVPALDDVPAMIAPAVVCQRGASFILVCFLACAALESIAPPPVVGTARLNPMTWIRMSLDQSLFTGPVNLRNWALFLVAAFLKVAERVSPCEVSLYAIIRTAASDAGVSIIDAKRAHAPSEFPNEVNTNIFRPQLLCPLSFAFGAPYIYLGLLAIAVGIIAYRPRGPSFKHSIGYQENRFDSWNSYYGMPKKSSEVLKTVALNTVIGLLTFAALCDALLGVVTLFVVLILGDALPMVGGVKISDLDQVVAIAVGLFSLVYSSYACVLENRKLKEKLELEKREREERQKREEY